jgi:hypothetical protein
MLRIAPVANEQTENPIGSVRASRWKPFAKSKPLFAGDVPAGAVSADHWKRQASWPRR